MEPFTFRDLIADVGNDFDAEEALNTWRWLVPSSAQALLLTALGDLFMTHADGSIWWLDTTEGTFINVAESFEHFNKTELQKPENQDHWFLAGFVQQLISVHGKPGVGECFSATIPLVLGGKFEPDNWLPTHWRVHFHSLGQIHEQVKDLAPGTPITSYKFTPL